MSFAHSNQPRWMIFMKNGEKDFEFWDEQLEETKLSGHDCSHKGYSMLYLHQGIKDETT